jgi:hypothetical protein
MRDALRLLLIALAGLLSRLACCQPDDPPVTLIALDDPLVTDDPPEAPLKLTYFDVMAKGLAPSLVLEVSGLPWEGVHPTDWAAMKPTTLFGQLPQLETADGLRLAQMAAIVNFVAARAGAAATLLQGTDKRGACDSGLFIQRTREVSRTTGMV